MNASEIGRALSAMRKTFSGGRSVLEKQCPKCKRMFSTRDVRKPCPLHEYGVGHNRQDLLERRKLAEKIASGVVSPDK